MNVRQMLGHAALLAVLAVPVASVQAMEVLDDEQMAQATGQDGVSISLELPEVGGRGQLDIAAIAYKNNDGIAVGIPSVPSNSPAHLYLQSFPSNQNSGNAGFSFNSLNPVSVHIDADGDGGEPVLNIAIQAAPDLTNIRWGVQRIGLAPSTAGSRFDINGTNNVDIVRFSQGSDLTQGGIEFDFVSPFSINVQLGYEPQGHMVVFNSLNLNYVDLGTVRLQSEGASLDDHLALDVRLTNLNLSGMYLDLDTDGMKIGYDGVLPAFNLYLDNIGVATASANPAAFSSSAFDGLNNGAMGNVGVEGLSFTNLRVNISGM
ncbi:MAG: DUF6160 family protein [Pseudomonadota bacterium]|nr:DUF6160 family protein [Pseudomonadota bacterium]